MIIRPLSVASVRLVEKIMEGTVSRELHKYQSGVFNWPHTFKVQCRSKEDAKQMMMEHSRHTK